MEEDDGQFGSAPRAAALDGARGDTERYGSLGESLSGDGSSVVEWRTSTAEPAFVRIEVRHSDGHMAALTNPVVLA